MNANYRNASLIMMRDTAANLCDLQQDDARGLEFVAKLLRAKEGETGLETYEEKRAYADLCANIEGHVRMRRESAEKFVELGQAIRTLINKARVRDELAAKPPEAPTGAAT